MTTRQLKDLKSWDVKRIDAMFEEHGTDSYGIGIVSRAFKLTESSAKAMATAILESKSPRNSVTGSAAPDLVADTAAVGSYGAHKAALASKLSMQVRAAEAKPISECTLQELQSLAAAGAAEAGMFGA